jgi:hypothetical protein
MVHQAANVLQAHHQNSNDKSLTGDRPTDPLYLGMQQLVMGLRVETLACCQDSRQRWAAAP